MSTESENLRRHAKEDARGLLRRLTFGLSSQAFIITALILRNIAVVPVFISTHGVAGYADWVKMMAVSTLLVIVSLGQNYYYGYQVRTARAERDYDRMNQVIADANGFFIVLYVVVGVLLVAGLLVVDVASLLNLEQTGRLEASVVLGVLLASLVGQVYRDTLRGIYIAYGELTRSEVIQALANIALAVAVIGALLLDASLLTIAVLYVAAIPGLVCSAAWWDFRRYREVEAGVSWRPPALTRERLRRLVAHGVPQLTERLLRTGPMVLLGVFGVPSATVVQFNLARTAGNLLRARQFAMVFSVELSRQRTQADWPGFHRLHRRGAAVIGVFGGGIAGGMLGLWDLFLPVWTGGAVTPDMLLIALMVAETAVIAFGEHSMALLRWGGRIADVARCQLAATVFAGALAIPALAIGGVYPMLVVMTIGALLFLHLMPGWYARRNMGASAWAGIALPPLTGLLTAAVVYALLQVLRGMFAL